MGAHGDLHPDLANRLAGEASKIAQHFSNICIRALDYCPPVDIRFGEFLRAIVTADSDLVPEDDWGYRPALIEAFRLRGVVPEDVTSYSEEALRWCPPEVLDPRHRVSPCPDLDADDGADPAKLHGWAKANAAALGLSPDTPISVHSFHPLHRVGPDGAIVFDYIVELLQKRLEVLAPGERHSPPLSVLRGRHGGAEPPRGGPLRGDEAHHHALAPGGTAALPPAPGRVLRHGALPDPKRRRGAQFSAPSTGGFNMADQIRVRMYRVGFGDCFLLTFPGPRHVLVDCGVHSQGNIDTLAEAVAHLAQETEGKLDIVVATHVHQDHISGFASCAATFAPFQVKEVWLPWTEDPGDESAARLKRKHAAMVRQLTAHFQAVDGARYAPARAALENLAPNQAALATLRGWPGATVRYLEAGKHLEKPAGIPELQVKVLGPPRSADFLSKMDPPEAQRYLALQDGQPVVVNALHPFPAKWQGGDGPRLRDRDRKLLEAIAAGPNEGLAFALDQAVNNTSVVAAFLYRGQCLLFAGDAQYGNWKFWLEGEGAGELLARVNFYKVSHHGSLNATPKGALEKMSGERFAAMVSTQNRPWPSIPYPKLMDALGRRCARRVLRSDSIPVPKAPRGPVLDRLPKGFARGKLWFDYLIPVS